MIRILLPAALLALAPAALAKDPRPEIVIAAPPEGMGQVVFFRPGGMGGAISCAVSFEEKRLSSLPPNRYFVHVTEPGEKTYSVKSEATDRLTVEVLPGETQYVRCNITVGVMVGRPNLSPSTEEAFRKAAPKLRLVEPKDPPGENESPTS